MRSPDERFWEKVDKSAGPDGCWLWMAYRDPNGYGRFMVSAGVASLAHRYAYQAVKGPITLGLDHLCRNPPCVNPAHLEPVTQAENVARQPASSRAAQARPNASKTHCPKGHAYTEDNVQRVHNAKVPNGRQCIACKRAAWRDWYQRRKAERAHSRSRPVR